MDRDQIERELRGPAPDEPAALRPLDLERPHVSPVRANMGARADAKRVRSISMVVALAMSVALVFGWQLASVGETVPSSEPHPTASPATSATQPSSDPITLGARFQAGGISFDYPEAWQIHQGGGITRFGSSIAIVGTADLAGCTDASGAMDLNCAHAAELAPGEVLLIVGTAGRGPTGSILDMEPSGGFQEFIDGMPAVVRTWTSPTLPGEEGRDWMIGMPGVVNNWYAFDARMREPGIEPLRQQVDAVVKSLRFDGPVPVLPTDPALMAAALRPALDALDRSHREQNSRMYSCFPRTPDSSAAVTIEDGQGGPLAGPLDVVCSVEMEPTPIALWAVTLSVRWESGPGYEAGEHRELLYLDSRGELGPRYQLTHIAFPAPRPDPTPGPAIPVTPGTLVEVLPPGVSLLLTPDPEGNHLTSLPRGARLWIQSGPRKVGSESWYRVEWQPTPTYGGIPAWIESTFEAHAVVAPVEPRCPAVLSDVIDLVDLHPAERLLCFGDRPITLGPVILEESANATAPASGTPAWLADSAIIKMHGSGGPGSVHAPLLVRADPAAIATLPTGAWIEVTGHFDDPAAQSCRRTWVTENESPSPQTKAEQILSCREQFVITGVRAVPAP